MSVFAGVLQTGSSCGGRANYSTTLVGSVALLNPGFQNAYDNELRGRRYRPLADLPPPEPTGTIRGVSIRPGDSIGPRQRKRVSQPCCGWLMPIVGPSLLSLANSVEIRDVPTWRVSARRCPKKTFLKHSSRVTHHPADLSIAVPN